MVVFDIHSLSVLARIRVGGNPDCIIYDPASRRIFTMNGDTRDTSVIDPVHESVFATVPMGGRPEFAVADGEGMIYDNIEDKNEVAVLDSKALTIKDRWPIGPAGGRHCYSNGYAAPAIVHWRPQQGVCDYERG